MFNLKLIKNITILHWENTYIDFLRLVELKKQINSIIHYVSNVENIRYNFLEEIFYVLDINELTKDDLDSLIKKNIKCIVLTNTESIIDSSHYTIYKKEQKNKEHLMLVYGKILESYSLIYTEEQLEQVYDTLKPFNKDDESLNKNLNLAPLVFLNYSIDAKLLLFSDLSKYDISIKLAKYFYNYSFAKQEDLDYYKLIDVYLSIDESIRFECLFQSICFLTKFKFTSTKEFNKWNKDTVDFTRLNLKFLSTINFSFTKYYNLLLNNNIYGIKNFLNSIKDYE